MPPKSAPAKSSAQPTRVSSRAKAVAKPVPEASAPVAKAPAGKRKADEAADARPSKKRSPAVSTKVVAKPVPKASAPVAKAPASKRKADESADAQPSKKRSTAVSTKPTAAKASKASRKTTTKQKSDGVTEAAPERAHPSAAAKETPQAKPLPEINTVPTEKLDVFVMGEGESGELGLGTEKKAIGVKRPRLHPLLSSGNIDVVHLALGGMHAAALTRDNEILTWGVNDDGACGRDTTWEGNLKDMDASTDEDSDSDGNDNGLNPLEVTPTAISSAHFPKGTKFVQLAAGDSCTFALTADGLVYGCGTFRDNNGVLGFRPDLQHARTPILIPELKNIKHLACGNNHALALDASGNVFVWGAGEQNQLGRRIVERTRMSCLAPRLLSLPKKQVKYISSGGDHSFAITKNEKVYSWGLNNYGQTGIPDNAGQDEAIIPAPTVVKQLSDYKLAILKGGSHHALAVTDDGACLVWGRAEGGQLGIETETLAEEDVIKNRGRVGILKKPTALPGLKCKYATTASDHSIALATNGQAYSWGFSGRYQTGLGTDEDVKTATLIDNTAVRGKDLNWAGTGGQYSVLTTLAGTQKPTMVNGPSAIASPAAVLPQRPAGTAGNVNGVADGGAPKLALVNGIASPKKEDKAMAALLTSSDAVVVNGV